MKPFMDDQPHGIFAIRAPSRPNPIGLSVVRLLRVEGSRLFIRELDIVDGTPLLDIKPYVPKFDTREVERTGWLEQQAHRSEDARDDGRFCDK
jgi:tRNA-Thr(GGU) m(6)t(6)A37 methyltransferase TsaA